MNRCDICQSTFSDRQSLSRHRKSVHQQLRLFCQCGTSFSDKSNYNRHVHNGSCASTSSSSMDTNRQPTQRSFKPEPTRSFKQEPHCSVKLETPRPVKQEKKSPEPPSKWAIERIFTETIRSAQILLISWRIIFIFNVIFLHKQFMRIISPA